MGMPESPDKMVLDAAHETQDSQAIFDAHQALYGAASVRISPAAPSTPRAHPC